MSSPASFRRAVRALVVAGVLLGSVGAQAASAVTVRVDNDKAQCPNARFRRISTALAFVAPGDTVLVCRGTYHGAVRMDKPGVRLAGVTANRRDVALVPAPGDTRVVEMAAPATTLANLSVRADGPGGACAEELIGVDNGQGAFAEASVIAGVAVRGTVDCGSPGIAIRGRAVVRDSRIAIWDNGISATGSATIQRNVIHASVSDRPFGSGIFGGDRIEHNHVSGFDFGVVTHASVVVGNDVSAVTGMTVETPGGAVVGENVVHDTLFGGLQVKSPKAVVWGNVVRASNGGLTVGTSQGVVSGNIAERHETDGIIVSGAENSIVGNRASNNLEHGLVVGGARNTIVGNRTANNATGDCLDVSTGSGTAGTANTWIHNIGANSAPPGICQPPAAVSAPTAPPTTELPTPPTAAPAPAVGRPLALAAVK